MIFEKKNFLPLEATIWRSLEKRTQIDVSGRKKGGYGLERFDRDTMTCHTCRINFRESDIIKKRKSKSYTCMLHRTAIQILFSC